MNRTLIAVCLVLPFIACSNPDTRFETDVEVPVSVEEVGLKTIEEFVETTGTINATKDVTLSSESAGYYRLEKNPATNRPFALGDFVKKGQVIIYIDNPEQENSIKIDSVKLSLEISKNEYEKQQSLYDKGGVTLRELRDAERSYIDAKYSYDNALIQLEKLKIVSPFDGVIVNIPYYTPGVKVASGSEMVRIMNYQSLNMDVNLPGNLLGKIAVGQPVRVMNYTIPDKILEGRLTQVSPALETETRTFKATVDIENPDWILRPGMFVKASIITAGSDSTIVIPKDIVMMRRNTKSVFVVERGIAQQRMLKTGLENPDEVQVTDGLAVNERLVVKGFETLRSGSKVKINQ
ncbi:MAG: efflux RND transporter periplasmic adaptor subunit [Candidatus Latescibacteria bacterium]|nr:efflux RND transporter periplasmic adaptor subunit [Candidatus Latescibacterota bacterium]